MKPHAAWVSCVVGLMLGCSDASAPSTPAEGTFQAQLTGARVASVTGSANAGVIYTEEFPDARFAIRMFAERGDTLRTIVILCPGAERPSPGTYPVSPAAEACTGSYVRAVLSMEGAITILENADASAGSVTVGPSSEGANGSFRFSGTLVIGADSVGPVTVSGYFRAVVF